MAKKKSTTTSRRKGSTPCHRATDETPPSLMYPALHQQVVDALAGTIGSTYFKETDTDQDSTNEHPTNIMGKFVCANEDCKQDGWGSKKIATLIRGYPGNGYNAVVYGQRCKSCSQLGTMTMDVESYVDRVTYRLKRWAGVYVDPVPFRERDGPPHETALCEGCKRGICRQSQF